MTRSFLPSLFTRKLARQTRGFLLVHDSEGLFRNIVKRGETSRYMNFRAPYREQVEFFVHDSEGPFRNIVKKWHKSTIYEFT